MPSSLTMSGSTLRFLPLSVLEISASPTEPYRWPSSLALASMVKCGTRAICSAMALRSAILASLACETRFLCNSSSLQVVRRRHGRQALRQQIIAAIAVLDLDEIALLAEVGNVFGQHQLHAAVLALEDLIAFSWLAMEIQSEITSTA